MSYGPITWDDTYFEHMLPSSWASASEVVPRLIDLVQPASVLDVGCAQGTWARVFKDQGIAVKGVDGHDVSPSLLLIDQDEFVVHDLAEPLAHLGRFDLVICLEVAHYLPAESSQEFVAMLTSHADVVLFSAAIPWQGGKIDSNEQWPSYWVERFEREGYEASGDFRWEFWDNEKVADWFRQNMLLFARPEAIRPAMAPLFGRPVRNVVHPATFERVRHALLHR